MPGISPLPLGQLEKEKIEALITQDDLEVGFSVFQVSYIASQQHQQKVFKAKDIENAEKLARKYCLASRTKFIRVAPFIVDLEKETEMVIEMGKI